MRSSYLAAGIMIILATATADAQKSNTQGFMGNIHITGVGMKRPEQGGVKSENESGGGAGVRLGWGFSPNFTMYLGLDGSKLDFEGPDASGEYTAAFFDIGVTYYFAKPTRALIPYIEVAATGRAIGSTIPADPASGAPESEFVQGGGGYTLGAGINYYFTRAAALNVGLSLSGGDFENAEFDKVEQPSTKGSATSSRLNIGLTFFPMKK